MRQDTSRNSSISLLQLINIANDHYPTKRKAESRGFRPLADDDVRKPICLAGVSSHG
jgi:hypothetical protein